MKSRLASLNSNLVQRVVTGLVLASIVFTATYWNVFGFMALLVAINLLTLKEFYTLYQFYTGFPRNLAGIILSLFMLSTCFLFLLGKANGKVFLINIPFAFGIYILELYLKSKHPITNLAMLLVGIVSITVPLCLFAVIGFLPDNGSYNPHVILGCFLTLWANDTGAFFVGKYFGKRKLFKRLSPNKTWEGSLGGAICTIIIAYVNSFLLPVLTAIDWKAIALIVIITGTFGDLIKSMMKRSLNIKDSGDILPGHGGMLDRFDTLLGSAPFIFSYFVATGYA